MNYKIETIPRFEKDAKRLKKKFPKIKNDLATLIKKLSLNPELGINLGENLVTIYSKTEQENLLTEKLKKIIQEEIRNQ